MNPFQPLYDECNIGDAVTKYTDLPKFPRMIDVELTSSCNFRCLMCPTGNLSLQRKAEFMDFPVIYRILTQAWKHGTGIRFIGWGEPTLHPNLHDAIDLATRYGLLTHVNTNGSKIDQDFARDLVRVGLSSIKFSFQGASRETYAEMRNTDFFDGMLGAIVAMREARGDGSLPYIAASTTITYESPALVASFKRKMDKLVDQLTIGRTVFDFMDLKAVRLKPHEKRLLDGLKGMATNDRKHPNPCPEVFQKLSIHADGSVRVCCNDFSGVTNLGNVMDAALEDIWRHPEIEAYRKRLAAKKYSGPLCSVCWDYQDLTSSSEWPMSRDLQKSAAG